MFRVLKPLCCSLLLVFAGAAGAADPAKLRGLALDYFAEHRLASLLVQVRVDGEVALELAHGEAMSGVPLSADMHFRNGAVAIAYVAAIMLRLAEEEVLDLDEPIARWLPDMPGAASATPRMLANMTAGYPDHVANEDFIEAFYADPFREWRNEDLLAYSHAQPRPFAPGENWRYSHSGYVVLGEVLEAATGRTLAELMREYVLELLSLSHTRSEQTALIPDPAVHGFTGERGVFEDATHWNPSWTLPEGAVQTTTLGDMARSFDQLVGGEAVLSEDSRRQMIAPSLIGFGRTSAECPACRRLDEQFSYGLGVALRGDWVLQAPRFGGYTSTVMTLPAERDGAGRRITVAVANTVSREGWDDSLPNHATVLAERLARRLAPESLPASP